MKRVIHRAEADGSNPDIVRTGLGKVNGVAQLWAEAGIAGI